MLQDVYIYLWPIYTHTYVIMQKPCCYVYIYIYMQAKQEIHVFFLPSSSPQRFQKKTAGVKSPRSEPHGEPLADISWWITWISSSATMRERPGGLREWPWSAENPDARYGMRYLHENHKWKPFIVGFFIHLGYQKLDIFGKWKLKLIALPEIKTKLRKKIMKIDATKHTRTEPFQFLGACYAQVVFFWIHVECVSFSCNRSWFPSIKLAMRLRL